MKLVETSDVLLLNIPISRESRINKKSASVLSMPPLGLLYIYSTLIGENYRVSFIDLAVERISQKEFQNIISYIKPKMVGISTYFESWSAMKIISQFIKDINKNTIVVGGGSCANFCSERLLNELKFDYVSLGEGEKSFLDLCDFVNGRKDISECEGVVYKDNFGKIIKKDSKRIEDLDALPFPSREIIDLKKYVYPFTISTARGCPGQCIFCSSQAFWGKKVKFRTINNIINEIKYLDERFSAKEFFIVDDTFTVIPNRTVEFCDALKKLNTKFIWGCESRADVVTKELLLNMYESGCRKIQFGLESADNLILSSIKKNITFEQVEKAVKIASEIGFDINVSVIIGHAEDTIETILYTINKSKSLRDRYGANILYSINTPYPGTEQFINANEMGIDILTNNFDFYSTDKAIINTKHLNSDQINYLYNKVVYSKFT